MGKKFVRCLGLSAALAALTVAADPAVVAQDKKAKKPEVKTATSKGTVKIGEGKDGKFRFSIYDGDNVFLGMSSAKGFDTRAEAVKGVEALKAALANAKVVDKPKTDEDEKEPKAEKDMKKAKDAK